MATDGQVAGWKRLNGGFFWPIRTVWNPLRSWPCVSSSWAVLSPCICWAKQRAGSSRRLIGRKFKLGRGQVWEQPHVDRLADRHEPGQGKASLDVRLIPAGELLAHHTLRRVV